MDAVTALGVAAATVQFLTFTGEVISKGREIYLSADGTLVSEAEIQIIAQHLKDLCKPLRAFEQERAARGPELDLITLCKGCVRVADELGKSITKLKVQGSHLRKWKNFRQALNSVQAEADIEQMTKRLSQFRSQIDTTLLFILRAKVEELAENQKKTTDSISQALLKSVVVDRDWQSQLINSIQQQRLENGQKSEAEDFAAVLSSSAEIRRQHMVEAAILERLKFPNMYDRHECIPDAYQQTFGWIFNDTSTTDSEKIFDNYVHWLRGDKRLYWITGKPGAGKSTLIKYLFGDDRTRRNAKVWSSRKDLILAGFFFWNSGTELQMSKEGMIRSLIHQVLDKHRDLVSKSFKQSWINYELWGGDLIEWRWKELVDALKAMIEHSELDFLIYIDGLDEFSGDHSELIAFVMEFSKIQNLKLCVASRPWLLFEEAFGKLPRLVTETLTRNDIEHFVTQKFRDSERFMDLQIHEPEEAKILIDEVTGKAQGVFLWVKLVVQALVEGLRDGDSMRDLRTRLLDLPSDLEDLFQRILDRLDPHYFRQASILFQLMDAAVPRPLTVLNVLFAEEGIDRAIQSGLKPLSIEQRASRAEGVRRKLNSRIKGLLEVTPVKSEPDRAHVQYLHRTVKDYLAREDIWQQILKGTDEDFHPSLSLCGAYLLDLKTMETVRNTNGVKRFWDAVRGCLDHGIRIQDVLGHKQLTFFDEMDKANVKLFEKSHERQISRYWTDSAIECLDGLVERKAWVYSSPGSSFLEYAIYRGLHQYLELKVSSGAINSNLRIKGRSLLHHASTIGDKRMIRFLLEHNADPNLAAKNGSEKPTPWQEFLRHLDREYRKDSQQWYNLSSLFIAHGANLKVLIYPPNDSGLWDSHAYAILRWAFGRSDGAYDLDALLQGVVEKPEEEAPEPPDGGKKVKRRHFWKRNSRRKKVNS